MPPFDFSLPWGPWDGKGYAATSDFSPHCGPPRRCRLRSRFNSISLLGLQGGKGYEAVFSFHPCAACISVFWTSSVEGMWRAVSRMARNQPQRVPWARMSPLGEDA